MHLHKKLCFPGKKNSLVDRRTVERWGRGAVVGAGGGAGRFLRISGGGGPTWRPFALEFFSVRLKKNQATGVVGNQRREQDF